MPLPDAAEALRRFVAPGDAPRLLLCEPAAAGPGWPALLAAASDPFAPSDLVAVGAAAAPGGPAAAPAEPSRLAATIAATLRPRFVGQVSAAELQAALARGEILLRYQPVVRLADRRPVMLEALARWHHRGRAVPADGFVPLAEGAGLGFALAEAVLERLVADLGPAAPRLPVPVSLNLPLAVLLRPGLAPWLRRRLAAGGLRPDRVLVELTETTEVRDAALLRRALRGLGEIGVLLDDLELDDGRRWLFALPFRGVKLDRSLVRRLPLEARARQQGARIVEEAHARGMTVTAEGVADRRLWRAVAEIGCDAAQGWAVARPLAAAALPSWAAAWRGVQPPP